MELEFEDAILIAKDDTRTSSWVERLTVAHLLLAGVVLLGAVMRLSGLADLPLSLAESAESLTIHHFWQDEVAAFTSPAYFSLTAILQPIIGTSDSAMRLIPALFGIGLVGLPWFVRQRIGTVGALTTSLLFALSPILSHTARTAGGDSIALFAGTLLLVALLNYNDTSHVKWLTAAVIALAIGIATAPVFYTILVGIIALWLSQRIQIDRDQQKRLAVIGGVTAIAVSTMVLWQPAGLGATATVLTDWIGRIQLGNGWSTPFLAIARYEIPLLVFIIPALLLARQREWLYPLIGGVLIILLQAGTLINSTVVLIPAYFLIGILFERIVQSIESNSVWFVVLGVIGWCVVAFVNIGRYLRRSPDQFQNLLITALMFLFVSLLILTLSRHIGDTVAGSALGLLAFLLFFNWGTAWSLNHHTGNDPRELWVSTGTDSDVRALLSTLQEASYQLERANSTIEIVSSVDTPVLRWYLRDFSDVTYAEAIAPNATNEALITPSDAAPVLNGNYAQAVFDVAQTGIALSEDPTTSERFRWWLFRKNDVPLTKEQVAVWLEISE